MQDISKAFSLSTFGGFSFQANFSRTSSIQVLPLTTKSDVEYTRALNATKLERMFAGTCVKNILPVVSPFRMDEVLTLELAPFLAQMGKGHV